MKCRPTANIDTLLRIRYSRPELDTDDMRAIFGAVSSSTICKLRKMARDLQAEEGVKTIGTYTVSTPCAYKAWGIDVKALERGRRKLLELGLYDKEEA